MSATTSLAARLGRIKEKAGLRNEDLAAIAGCSNSLIGHLCTGVRDNPAMSYLAAIARALDVDLDWLADDRGQEPTDTHLEAAGERYRGDDERPTLTPDPARAA